MHVVLVSNKFEELCHRRFRDKFLKLFEKHFLKVLFGSLLPEAVATGDL